MGGGDNPPSVKLAGWYSIFFNHLNFQIVEINLFNETVLPEPRFVSLLEFTDRGVQPDWVPQIHFVADLLQAVEYLVGAGVISVITDDRILYQMIIFPYFTP